MWLGTGIHLSLQFYYARFNDYKDLQTLAEQATDHFSKWALENITRIRSSSDLEPEHLQMLHDTMTLGLGMLEGYFPWARTQDNFRVLHVEESFETPIWVGQNAIIQTPDGPVELWTKGRIDGLVELPDGQLWLLEHKTMKSIATEYYVLIDEQGGVYINAAKQMPLVAGRPIQGVLYNLLRKKVPARPEVLKKGGITKRKNIDTTYEIYLEALRRAGEDPTEYGEILSILQEKGNRFFQREWVFRTEAEQADLQLRIFHIAREMFNNPVIYPNPDFFRCRGCAFKGVSLAMSNNADWQWMLQANFEQRKDFELAEDPLVNDSEEDHGKD
jgi:hypothetical protein